MILSGASYDEQDKRYDKERRTSHYCYRFQYGRIKAVRIEAMGAETETRCKRNAAREHPFLFLRLHGNAVVEKIFQIVGIGGLAAVKILEQIKHASIADCSLAIIPQIVRHDGVKSRNIFNYVVKALLGVLFLTADALFPLFFSQRLVLRPYFTLI